MSFKLVSFFTFIVTHKNTVVNSTKCYCVFTVRHFFPITYCTTYGMRALSRKATYTVAAWTAALFNESWNTYERSGRPRRAWRPPLMLSPADTRSPWHTLQHVS